jgi:hypothetical protein
MRLKLLLIDLLLEIIKYKKLLYSCLCFFVLCFNFNSFAQKDSVSITNYRNNFIFFNDIGFNTAPFNIQTKHVFQDVKLKYRNNLHDYYGVGCHYKWFSLRLNLQLPGSVRPTRYYGRSNYFHLGVDFSYKKFFFDIDFYRYKGFALMDAFQYNPTFNENKPNDIFSDLVTKSFSVNTWYFHKKNFSMSALRGKTAVFNKRAITWYVKGTLNSFGLNNSPAILPAYLYDPQNTKTKASTIHAFDIGLVPGIAFADTKNNWHYNVLAGLGMVVQEKGYRTYQGTRFFIGLAPRFDIRVMGGYNTPSWFLMLHTDFDNKSIQFTNLSYSQTYFTIRLAGGYRFGMKK